MGKIQFINKDFGVAVLDKAKIQLQYLLPKQGLTHLAGWFAKQEAGFVTQWAIKAFAKCYKIDMSQAQHSEFSAYKTFNEFFVRPLKESVRSIVCDSNTLAMPADGYVSQLGKIQGQQIFQAKGHDYSVEALLAGQYQLSEHFKDGDFITSYLSPSDYHRVHMPCDGTLLEMIYVPGDLFSVSPLTAQNIPNLFARNERLICVFDTEHGKMVQILVGATIVGSIETVWCGCVNKTRSGIIQRTCYDKNDAPIRLKKGEEMGRFKLGSTVINLFESNKIHFADDLMPTQAIRMGELLAIAK